MKYKNVLGSKNVPKSFDKWQELKYNDKEKWEELKKCYREVIWQVEAQKNCSKIISHATPFENMPNSIIDRYNASDKLIQRRYYGRTGKPRLDLDMTDHGNPKEHSIVPHYHTWYEIGAENVERSIAHDKRLEKWHMIANNDILE